MSATETLENASSLISALGLDDSFQPQEPATTKDTGLSEALIEDLILKFLSGVGSESGRAISDQVCLPLAILEDRFTALRQRQEIAPSGSAMLGDHIYRLTDVGRDRAHRALRECAYVGPAPVPLEDYVSSVHAQTIASEKPRKRELDRAFSDIHVEPEMFNQLGPAINAPAFTREQHELLALVAPRPFLLVGGDSADGDRSWPFIEAALPVYRLYGGPPRVGLLNHKGGHAVPPEAERAIAEWMETYTLT